MENVTWVGGRFTEWAPSLQISNTTKVRNILFHMNRRISANYGKLPPTPTHDSWSNLILGPELRFLAIWDKYRCENCEKCRELGELQDTALEILMIN